MRLHGLLNFCFHSRSSREKRSGRPWPKNDAMPGFIFPPIGALVNLTNAHRGCAFQRLYGSAPLIAKSRRRILVVLREFVGFHTPHFPPNQCAPRWGKHPISKRSQACSPGSPSRSGSGQRRTSVRFCYSGPGDARRAKPGCTAGKNVFEFYGSTEWGSATHVRAKTGTAPGFPSSFWTKTGYLRRWRCSNGEPAIA